MPQEGSPPGIAARGEEPQCNGQEQAGVCSSLLGGKRREEADGSAAAADTARGLRR